MIILCIQLAMRVYINILTWQNVTSYVLWSRTPRMIIAMGTPPGHILCFPKVHDVLRSCRVQNTSVCSCVLCSDALAVSQHITSDRGSETVREVKRRGQKEREERRTGNRCEKEEKEERRESLKGQGVSERGESERRETDVRRADRWAASHTTKQTMHYESNMKHYTSM